MVNGFVLVMLIKVLDSSCKSYPVNAEFHWSIVPPDRDNQGHPDDGMNRMFW